MSDQTPAHAGLRADPPAEISPRDASDLLASSPGEVLLLDCRTPGEHATARISGSILAPMRELPEWARQLHSEREKLIIVHCHHGVRSLQVAAALRRAGFARVTSMAGGIDRWSTDVDPSVPRY